MAHRRVSDDEGDRVQELENWAEEKRSAYLYTTLSEVESHTPRGALFAELRREAEQQAAIWADQVRSGGGSVPARYVPDVRARVVAWLVRRLGARALRAVLSAMKVRGMSLYTTSEAGHPMPQSLDDLGRRHRGVDSGGNLRAAVFGINDGLISNTSLLMGVAGAVSDSRIIVLTGVAGLIAGAFSMAAGEYVSVRSQREVYEYQIGLERKELDQYPDEEAEELALIYAARGLPRDEAHKVARRLIADPTRALDTLAREELGLNPDALGSPRNAALFSFFSFALGGLIPLIPFLVAGGTVALTAAAVVAALALFGVGAALSLFTGRNAWLSGLRMLVIGAIAGAVTYVIGTAFGAGLR
jgi:VIT1/CCC1 family predicted Fe2+/Mn2+ transporter